MARSQEPGARSQEPGARSQEPGARSQEPGAPPPLCSASHRTRAPYEGAFTSEAPRAIVTHNPKKYDTGIPVTNSCSS
jgi:hypothetical protein